MADQSTAITTPHRKYQLQYIMKQNHTVNVAPIKLNTKKLPQDFFGSRNKMPPLHPRLLHRVRETPQTQRNYPQKAHNLNQQNNLISETQVTSFFKLANDSNATTNVSPSNRNNSNQQYDQYEQRQVLDKSKLDKNWTQSIQLSKEYVPSSSKDNFLLTFAKNCKTDIENCQNLVTPLKRFQKIRETSISRNKGKSTELLKRNKITANPETQALRNSRKRRNSCKCEQIDYEQQTNRKVNSYQYNRKNNLQHFLPKIKNV